MTHNTKTSGDRKHKKRKKVHLFHPGNKLVYEVNLLSVESPWDQGRIQKVLDPYLNWLVIFAAPLQLASMDQVRAPLISGSERRRRTSKPTPEKKNENTSVRNE